MSALSLRGPSSRERMGHNGGPPMEVELPTFHSGQVDAWNALWPFRYGALRCGRRWGKTDFAKTIACDVALKGGNVGWFAPDYKISAEAFNEIVATLDVGRFRSSKVEGVIRTVTGGRFDFWTLDNERAGRSRKYNLAVVDEAAFGPKNMMDIWEQAIEPTLLDMNGRALMCSNTAGNDPENFFWRICNQKQFGFAEFHAPTTGNPLLPLRQPYETAESWMKRRERAFAKLRSEKHPLVYAQEYLAEFVDWSGVAFFAQDNFLVQQIDGTFGAPQLWTNCDMVFAIVDTATKTGNQHDATAVTYFAVNKTNPMYPLMVVDWDIEQIEGSLLETWLPTVFQNLEALAARLGARMGSAGAFIEDKNSGTVLIQQAMRRQWPAQAIESKLTAMGKDERAISVSGYHHRGMIKMGEPAFNKVKMFKGTTRNHFLSQVIGFRLNDPDAGKRADDLLDTYCYGVAIALGNIEGF